MTPKTHTLMRQAHRHLQDGEALMAVTLLTQAGEQPGLSACARYDLWRVRDEAETGSPARAERLLHLYLNWRKLI